MLGQLTSTAFSSIAVMVLKPTLALIHDALCAEGTRQDLPGGRMDGDRSLESF